MKTFTMPTRPGDFESSLLLRVMPPIPRLPPSSTLSKDLGSTPNGVNTAIYLDLPTLITRTAGSSGNIAHSGCPVRYLKYFQGCALYFFIQSCGSPPLPGRLLVVSGFINIYRQRVGRRPFSEMPTRP